MKELIQGQKVKCFSYNGNPLAIGKICGVDFHASRSGGFIEYVVEIVKPYKGMRNYKFSHFVVNEKRVQEISNKK